MMTNDHTPSKNPALNQEAKPLFLSVKETRKRLCLGHTTIYALIKSGRLKSCLFGRKRLIEAASVEALAAEMLSNGN